MGLASSQARLLSITARLTSNEYESQQISNAKMRLATKSQEASEAYIAALNDTQYSFVSFNSSGESVNTPLTASLLYEYADGKNQYILTNSAGKVLLGNSDITKFKSAKNLDEFLSSYGIGKEFKTDTLKESYEEIYGKTENGSQADGLIKYAQYWNYAVENYKYSKEDWATAKTNAQVEYLSALSDYTTLANNKMDGWEVSNAELTAKQEIMEEKKEAFTKLVTYVSAKESKLIEDGNLDKTELPDEAVGIDYSTLRKNYEEYENAVAKYQAELEKLEIPANEAYEYDDKSKAQWYTNLWYKLNGPSTDKSGLNNYTSFVAKNGIREHIDGLSDENKIPDNDGKIVNSTVWISNALSKGLVNIERASYTGDDMSLQDEKNPFKFTLNGISWAGQIYSSVSEIVEGDNDNAIAQAEAEYQRKNAEINAKDEKYQRKLSLLDSEHNAIQTEYESVKSAMNKNIDRSFKAFQG